MLLAALILHFTLVERELFLKVGVSQLLWVSKLPFISIFLTRFLIDLCKFDETEVWLGKIIKAAASLIADKVVTLGDLKVGTQAPFIQSITLFTGLKPN